MSDTYEDDIPAQEVDEEIQDDVEAGEEDAAELEAGDVEGADDDAETADAEEVDSEDGEPAPAKGTGGKSGKAKADPVADDNNDGPEDPIEAYKPPAKPLSAEEQRLALEDYRGALREVSDMASAQKEQLETYLANNGASDLDEASLNKLVQVARNQGPGNSRLANRLVNDAFVLYCAVVELIDQIQDCDDIASKLPKGTSRAPARITDSNRYRLVAAAAKLTPLYGNAMDGEKALLENLDRVLATPETERKKNPEQYDRNRGLYSQISICMAYFSLKRSPTLVQNLGF